MWNQIKESQGWTFGGGLRGGRMSRADLRAIAIERLVLMGLVLWTVMAGLLLGFVVFGGRMECEHVHEFV